MKHYFQDILSYNIFIQILASYYLYLQKDLFGILKGICYNNLYITLSDFDIRIILP